jgi:putative protease
MELAKVSHRSYTEASLVAPAGADSIFNERENAPEGEWRMVGTVVEANPKAGIVLEVRNAFNQGDEIEILPFRGPAVRISAVKMSDLALQPVVRTRPTTLVRLPFVNGVEAMHLVRHRINP